MPSSRCGSCWVRARRRSKSCSIAGASTPLTPSPLRVRYSPGRPCGWPARSRSRRAPLEQFEDAAHGQLDPVGSVVELVAQLVERLLQLEHGQLVILLPHRRRRHRRRRSRGGGGEERAAALLLLPFGNG